MNSNDNLDALQRQFDANAAMLAEIKAKVDALERGERRPQQQPHTPAVEAGPRMEDIKVGMKPQEASRVAGAIVRALRAGQ